MALKRIQVCREIWLSYVFITILCIVYCNGNVTLSSQSEDFWEDTDVTFTCSYDGAMSTRSFSWSLNRSDSDYQKAFVKSDCIIQGAWLNNTAQYEYRCHSNTTHSVTLKNITRSRQGEIWQCTVYLGATFGIQSNTAQIFVKVPVRVAYITPYNAMLAILENSTIAWQCKSSECRPKPKFRWFLESPYGNSTTVLEKDTNETASDGIQSYTSNFSFTLNRTWNMWFLSCGAQNKHDSKFVLSAKIQLNVTYPPDGPPKIRNVEDGNNVVNIINVIIGGYVNLECSVSGGNPFPRLEWNINNDSPHTVSGLLVRKNISWHVTTIETELQCQSVHHLTDTTTVSVNVLYPPETPEITVKTNSGNFVQVKTTLDVIEGKPYTVNCSAKSNPPVSLFKWNDLPPSNSSILFVEKTDRGHAETVACNVSNVMQISDTSPTVTGVNTTHLKLNVLYPPTVNILRDVTVIEEEEINYTCNFTQGNPYATNISWSWKGSLWNGQHLQLSNVSRNQAGVYRCNVQNIMAAADGSRELGNNNGTFNLTIQYKAKILKFTIKDQELGQVTLREHDTVNISCEIEGDPFPSGELLHQKACCNLQEQHQPFEASQQSFNLRLSRNFFAQCSDTGVQTCIGINTFYNGWHSMSNKSISLFVNCSPRKFSSFEVTENVTCALNATATFQFTAIAYPSPHFQWYQILDGVTTSEAKGGIIENSSISTNVMQINFILDHVEESHYGEYLLNLTNQYGTYQQRFYLLPDGQPSPPTSYNYYTDSLSSDSVTIWWEPGFDGGLNQSFIISYNVTATEWHNETEINQSKEHRMSKMSKEISGLASSTQYHILIYAKNANGAVRIPNAIVVHTKALPIDALQRSINVGAAVGGAVGGMLAILVMVVVIFLRKRSLGKRAHSRGKCDNKDPHIYSNFSKEMDINTSNVDDKACIRNSKQTALDSPKLPARMPLKLEPKHSLQELDDYDDKAEEKIYGNTKDIRKRIERITVSELYPYLTSKTTDFFGLEFQKLPTGLTKPYEFSQKSENIALNRYNGIYPYDHSRVKIADEPSFFINACYINGYRKKKAFIACLGPLARTTYNFVTFWRMVWSEKSDVIVMLTKLKEPSGVKCDQYWPDTDSVLSYGEVTVASLGEDFFADYVMRRFTLTKENKVRKLTQFHFMAWPDKSIPEDVTCLLEFRRRVNVNHSSGPIIVHCSAGIGRTGTLIALEILIEEGQREGSVNVVECVKTMRDQRTSMVQTVDQYYFIYKALVNALVFDCDTISVQKFSKYLDKANEDQLSKMFQALNQSVESDLTTESNARTANKMQRDKNRIGSDIPGDSHRVRLFLNRYEETSSEYINAVYTDSLRKNEHFIVAQSPLTDGVEDFLCMIYQVECSCIVSLGDSHQRTNVGSFIPIDDTQQLMIGSFNVTCKVLDTKDHYIIRKVKIQFKGRYEEGEKVVYHFEYNDWALSHKTPSDPHKFVSFTLEVEEFASQLGTGKSQVLVHCLNAYERSCLFCAVVTLIEKVKYEGEVCVPNVLRHIRARRRLAIPNMEQFQFCFKAVCAYIALDKTGPNVEEKAYINMALV